VDKTCQLCQQEIRSLSDFRTHILRDHRFACPFPGCELSFACKPKLEEHTITCHETDIKVDRTCPHCQNTIRGLTDYFRHVEKNHRFPCSLCPLRFAYRQKYEEHMLAAHGENTKADRTCPLCQTALKSLTEYRRHAALEHRFQCPGCGLRFACQAGLATHCLAMHGRGLAGSSFPGTLGSRSFSDRYYHQTRSLGCFGAFNRFWALAPPAPAGSPPLLTRSCSAGPPTWTSRRARRIAPPGSSTATTVPSVARHSPGRRT
jgi:uncharacterized C2H2 Zn-finger protein